MEQSEIRHSTDGDLAGDRQVFMGGVSQTPVHGDQPIGAGPTRCSVTGSTVCAG